QERVTIKNIIGKAEVRSPSAGKWRSARVGMVVKPKWDVRTFVESSLELVFEGGTVIKLGENSVVNLSILLKNKNISASNSKVKVASGQIMANVKKIMNKKSKFEFETPTAVASIRGTRLGIIVKKNKTVVDVYEGRVAVRKRGTKKEKVITTRNRAVVNNQESEVIMFKFEEIQQMSDSVSLIPIPLDVFAVDSLIALDSVKSDTLVIDTALTDTTITDSVKSDTLTIDTTKTDTLKNDSTGSVKNVLPSDLIDSIYQIIDTLQNIKENDYMNTNTIVTIDSTGHDDNKEDMEEFIQGSDTPDVNIDIDYPDDNSVVNTNKITVRGITSPNAKVIIGSVQGIANSYGVFSIQIYLQPGKNIITAKASYGSKSKQTQLSIEYIKPQSNFLSVTKPVDNMVLQKPLVIIEGVTLPVAEVIIDDIEIPVRADGSFSYKAYIPDEAGFYSFIVLSKYMGKEIKVEKTIEFKPVREKLTLNVSSPVNGQIINNPSISVVGKAISGAKIEITAGGGRFNKVLSTSTDGSFNCNIPVYEQDIGEYAIEIVARDEETGEEINKFISLLVNVKSPSINTSVPNIDVTGTSQGATKAGSFIITVIDQTFDDIIVLTVRNNGSEEQVTLDRSDQEKIFLDEGRNVYTIHAIDIAGNRSNTIYGEIFYLPGPLNIDIIEPDESMFSIQDLPPMPFNTGELSMDIKVVIDDNIGDVPHTILYCRVNGVNLKLGSDYTYIGNLKVGRGSNLFLVETEDIAGNKVKKSFTIIINE
ncbi:MAG: FecR family protein, partial [Chitinispirillia bacterium]